jgi:hypothetical protein
MTVPTQRQRLFTPWRICILVYLLALFFTYQAYSLGTPICFDDCGGYITLMDTKWQDYFHQLWSMYRSWTVPVFFSLFGEYTLLSASKVVLAQTWIGYFSWLFFAYACRQLFVTPTSKTIAFVAVSLMMFGQGYYHFHQRLLSDSIAMSTVLMQLSLCLLAGRYMDWCGTQSAARKHWLVGLYLVLLAAVSSAAMGARDANVFLALFGLLILLLCNRSAVFSLRYKILAVVLIIGVAVPQVHFAAERHRLNARNILAGAVLPNEEMRNFYLKHGMPPELAEAGKKMKAQNLSDVNIAETAKQGDIVDKVAPNFVRKSDKIYMWYLITHPSYWIENTKKNLPLIIDQSFNPSIHTAASPYGNTRVFVRDRPGVTTPFVSPESVDELSPGDWLRWRYMAIIVGIYVIYAACSKRRVKGTVPVLFMLAGLSNAMLAFYGDLWEHNEMARHAFIGSVVLRIGIVLSALFLIEGALGFYSTRRSRAA